MSTLALCIPAFNAEWCLPRLLQSAVSQKLPFNEVIVYDDSSTDATADVAAKFSATVIRGHRNVGCSAAKNILASHAKSEWLFFVDADDELYPEFTLVANEWITKDSADVVLMRYRYIDYSTGTLIDEPLYDRKQLRADTVKFSIENKIVNFELLKKKAFLRIGGFDEDPLILYVEDRAFAFKAAFHKLSFDAEQQIIGVKYYFPQSMSSTGAKLWPLAGYHLWKKVWQYTGQRYASEISSQLYQNAVWAAKSKNWASVKKSLTLASEISNRQRPPGSKFFQLCYSMSPFFSFYFRSLVLSMFKSKSS